MAFILSVNLPPGCYEKAVFGFVPLPLALYGAILGVVGGYGLAAEGLKQWFYRKFPG